MHLFLILLVPVKPTLRDLLKEFIGTTVAARWQILGIFLNFEHGRLQCIETNNAKDCNNCLLEVLSEWLKRDDLKPSWEAIVEAISEMGEGNQAKHLRAKYCSQ